MREASSSVGERCLARADENLIMSDANFTFNSKRLPRARS